MNNFQNFDDRKMFKWSCKKYHGTIEMSELADKNMFPQYFIDLKNVDSEDESKATLIVSLLQKDGIKNRLNTFGQYDYKAVKISVYKIINDQISNKSSHEKLDLNNQNHVKSIFESGKIFKFFLFFMF